MTRRRFLGCAMSIVIPLGAVGCAAKSHEHSGFLSDYSQLQPHPEIKNAAYYEADGHPLKDYSKFMIDPVVLHFAPDAGGVSMRPDRLEELTNYFEDGMKKALAEYYEVVQEPGPGVLRVRIALTDIKKTKAAWNVHPATKIAGFGLGGASMEAEAIDTQTNKRVAAIVQTHEGKRMSFKAGFQETGHARQVIDNWIEGFITRLNKAHGITN